MDTKVTVFEIDEADRIRRVDEAWLAFAAENDAADLVREGVLGEDLWRYVAGRDLRLLYRALFERVRKSRRAVEIPFRCDAPDEERHMQLRIEPIANGNALRFVSMNQLSVPREPLGLLDRDRSAAESERTLSICSLCKAIQPEPDRWLPLERAVVDLELTGSDPPPALSHGVCPACVDHLEDATRLAG